jgi:hypothetical protein
MFSTIKHPFGRTKRSLKILFKDGEVKETNRIFVRESRHIQLRLPATMGGDDQADFCSILNRGMLPSKHRPFLFS